MSGVDLEKVGDDFLAFAWENLSPRDRAKVMFGSPKTAWKNTLGSGNGNSVLRLSNP